MGIEAFAQRARRELQAVGEIARKRTVKTSGQLTAQEAQAARLARDGLSNPEIGTRLLISAHTCASLPQARHPSRSQLDRVLPSDRTPSNGPVSGPATTPAMLPRPTVRS